MSTLKCSICDSLLEISKDQKTVTCENCATIHNVAQLQKDNVNSETTVKAQPKKTVSESNIVKKESSVELDLTTKELSACDYLVRTIISEIKADYYTKEFFLSKSATSYSWKKSDNKKLADKMEIALKNSEKSKKYIIKKLEDRGFKNIKLEMSNSSTSCSTEKDWQKYDKDLEKYYSYSSAMQKLFSEPQNQHSGHYTYYTLTVKCKTDNKWLLCRKTEIPFTKKKKLKKALRVIVILAVIAASLLAIENFVVKKFYGYDSDASILSIVESFFDDEKIKEEKPKFYYVMADDCTAINIRSGSNKNTQIITVVTSHKTKLIPTGKSTDTWIQVVVDGETGWVYYDLVKKID